MGRKDKPIRSQFSRVNSLGYKFYRLAHLFAQALDARLASHNVTIGQFRLLLVLWEKEDVTQAEIAHLLDIEQPTVASTLRRMERDGLITTTGDPTDGRRTRIVLTKRAHLLKESLTREAQYVNELAVTGLSHDDIARLHSLLDHLTLALVDSNRS
ncbi:MAG: MarR family transcriptional regulator [Anaerolineales bacterium]|nr:MarR family transcriptional regulator [Anaerolineales bacterium]